MEEIKEIFKDNKHLLDEPEVKELIKLVESLSITNSVSVEDEWKKYFSSVDFSCGVKFPTMDSLFIGFGKALINKNSKHK